MQEFCLERFFALSPLFWKMKIISVVAVRQQRRGATPGWKQDRIQSLDHRRDHRRDFFKGSFQLTPKPSKVGASVLPAAL